jgi:hypothetical protein
MITGAKPKEERGATPTSRDRCNFASGWLSLQPVPSVRAGFTSADPGAILKTAITSLAQDQPVQL